MRIEQFKAIEGTASDVPQARTTISYDGHLYECLLFRLSGTPVALRVNGPIFIKNGETVRIVGRHNRNGVFEAVAYYNKSSRVSGNSDRLLVQRLSAIGIAIIGGIMLFFAAPFMSLVVRGALLFTDPLFVIFALLGLPLVLLGYVMFVRSRSEIRKIERLLNGE